MISNNLFGEFKYPLRSCKDCTILDYCVLKDDILSPTKIVCDFAKYGCGKYKSLETEIVDVPAHIISHKLLDVLNNHPSVTYRDILSFYPSLSIENFRAVISNLRKKGYNIIIVSKNTYKLNK